MTQTRQESIAALAELLAKQVTNVIDKNLRSCLNCINFVEATEICSIYNQRPPARIIAKACEQWFEADLPF